jgi:hypothetical protein
LLCFGLFAYRVAAGEPLERGNNPAFILPLVRS